MRWLILTKKIVFKPSKEDRIVLNSLAYASAKLWNIANYEKLNYKKLQFDKFPDWYEQKKRLKDNDWYKSLPSQTSQNVLDILHKSWKSFFKLKKTKGIQNPKPPRFKKDSFNFSFLNNGYKVIDTDTMRIDSFYKKKNLQLNHYFHSATKTVVDYCIKNNISKVVIGDITGIRKNANLGKANNQKFHALPYERIYSLFEYKLKKQGIELIKQKEYYSSQVSPFAPKVGKVNATKNKRKHRGLYIDKCVIFNADSVGAFNILRLYEQKAKIGIPILLKGLSNPIKLNVSM